MTSLILEARTHNGKAPPTEGLNRTFFSLASTAAKAIQKVGKKVCVVHHRHSKTLEKQLATAAATATAAAADALQ